LITLSVAGVILWSTTGARRTPLRDVIVSRVTSVSYSNIQYKYKRFRSQSRPHKVLLCLVYWHCALNQLN